MSAVRLDADAFGDPRIEYLAKLAGYSEYEALGRLAWLWRYCTARQLYALEPAIIESHLAIEADALVKAGLGEHSFDGRIRIRGTEGRIEWLAKLRVNSKAGGAATQNKWKLENEAKRRPEGQPNEGQTLGQTEAKARPEEGPLTLTPTLTLINSPYKAPQNSEPRKRGRPRKPALGEPSDAEMQTVREVLSRLGRKNGIRYEGSKAHIALIVGRLRDGFSEMDLRKVIGYCAEQWGNKPEMRPYLRPETLFGPTTITKYIDAARAWFDELPEEVAG